MKIGKGVQNYPKAVFTDFYNKKCSLELSTLAEPDCIWLGCEDIGLRASDAKTFLDIPLESVVRSGDDYFLSANTRMHLTRSMVKELLPHLQKFVETGNI